MEIAARFEHKILIDDARRAELLARFADRLLPDTTGSTDGRYPVVSLYCDTPDRRCHWEAWRGVPSRRKLRVRIYGTRDGSIPSATFVEVKHRDGREGAKRRVKLPSPTPSPSWAERPLPAPSRPTNASSPKSARWSPKTAMRRPA